MSTGARKGAFFWSTGDGAIPFLQGALAGRAPAVPAEGAVRTDHAVARDQNRNRIVPDRRSDGPRCLWMSNPFRQLAVTDQRAARDLHKFLPNANLKNRSFHEKPESLTLSS